MIEYKYKYRKLKSGRYAIFSETDPKSKLVYVETVEEATKIRNELNIDETEI